MTTTLGVDLGQARDKTALVAVRSHLEHEEVRARSRRRNHFDIVRIATLRPGMAYPAQVEQIVATTEQLATEGEVPTVWLDGTAIGRPVGDMLRDACPYAVHSVTSTGGNEVVRHGRLHVSAPKSVLVGGIEVALSTGRLHCPADLPGAAELRKELAAFSFELSAAGRPTYGGEGAHDDLVSALGLSLFGCERGGGLSAFREYMAGATNERAEAEYVR